MCDRRVVNACNCSIKSMKKLKLCCRIDERIYIRCCFMIKKTTLTFVRRRSSRMRSLVVTFALVAMTLCFSTITVEAGRPPKVTRKRNSKGTNSEKWVDNEASTFMWKTISGGQYDDLEQILESNPEAALVRSGDGRGPLWWAYEEDDQRMIDLLKKHGASDDEKDGDGNTPRSAHKGATNYQAEYQEEQPWVPAEGPSDEDTDDYDI